MSRSNGGATCGCENKKCKLTTSADGADDKVDTWSFAPVFYNTTVGTSAAVFVKQTGLHADFEVAWAASAGVSVVIGAGIPIGSGPTITFGIESSSSRKLNNSSVIGVDCVNVDDVA